MKNNEVLKLEWDRCLINYSDNVPVEALIKAGWRKATEPELKLEKIKQDLDQRIADTKTELKEAMSTSQKCIKHYKRGATFAIYDLIACNDYIKYTQYKLDALVSARKEFDDLEGDLKICV